MISWMQKHNKYLIVTIWIATIAFIGAGFVGWGSYQYGSKASNVAQVGDIKIHQTKLDMSYRNIYQQYNQMLQGKLDDKKAKEMGLIKQAFRSLVTQAQLLNLAQEFGIVVSEQEVYNKIASIPSFQTKGKLDEKVYRSYLTSQRLKAKDFEAIIHDEAVIEKLLSLLDSSVLPFEEKVLSSAVSVSDKISYIVLNKDDINVTITQSDVKTFWEKNKASYITTKSYKMDIVWTETQDTEVTEKEISDHYAQNSFNYVDSEGKQELLKDATERVTADVKMKKSKKSAQKQYISYKKGKIEKSETIEVTVDDNRFSETLWKEIKESQVASIMKPKAVKDRYATIKIVEIVEPREMSFEEAKEKATTAFEEEKTQELLAKLAQEKLDNFDVNNSITSPYISLDSSDNLNLLNKQETLQFTQKLFTSQESSGIIQVTNKSIVYKIVDQKIVSDKKSENLPIEAMNQMKKQNFESNLIQSLDKKYKTQVFVEGL